MRFQQLLKVGLIWMFLTGMVSLAQTNMIEREFVNNIVMGIPIQDGYIAAIQVACARTRTETPLWVLDRQQYETTYVYAPPRQPVITAPELPQWVLDRQQYEPTYTPPQADIPQCYSMEIG